MELSEADMKDPTLLAAYKDLGKILSKFLRIFHLFNYQIY